MDDAVVASRMEEMLLSPVLVEIDFGDGLHRLPSTKMMEIGLPLSVLMVEVPTSTTQSGRLKGRGGCCLEWVLTGSRLPMTLKKISPPLVAAASRKWWR
ncbi:hypothetical protein ACLOJK_024187 [Asimina triloba]